MYNDTLDDHVFHSTPLERERKYVKIINGSTASHLINGSSVGKERDKANEIELMLVDESKPLQMSHMPIVEIVNNRHFLQQHRPLMSGANGRSHDSTTLAPQDGLPSLNLQIDTLGASGRLNGQTNLRIESSNPSLSTLLDIIPSGHLKAIPMQVKSHKRFFSPSGQWSSAYDSASDQVASRYLTLNEVKKAKRNKSQNKSSGALELATKSRTYVKTHRPDPDEETQDDEDGESERLSQNEAKYERVGRHRSPSTHHSSRSQDDGYLYGPHSIYDDIVHPTRESERKNNQLDDSFESGVNERLVSRGFGGPGRVGSIARANGGEASTRNRQRSTIVASKYAQVDTSRGTADDSAPSTLPSSHNHHLAPVVHVPQGGEDESDDAKSHVHLSSGHRATANQVIRDESVSNQLQSVHLPLKKTNLERHPMASDVNEDGRDAAPMRQHKDDHQNDIKHHARNILWNYEDEGQWSRKFVSCDGIAQSPINIESSFVVDDTSISIDLMPSYDSKVAIAAIINTGLGVEIAHMNGPRPSITGSALYEDVFTFHQMHFHWGSKNSIGSEHAVFDQKYPMEMHLVHFNDKYESMEKAMKQPDGLTVIAVFLQVTKKDNARFDPLIKSLKRVNCGGTSVSFNGLLNLTNFLPSNINDFYRYQGSLTTPPCTESVLWLILKHGLLIGKNQLKKFRQLKQSDCTTPIMNNWRNIQPINGRRIDRATNES